MEMADQYGWTALMCAAADGALEVVDYLLKHGANSERQDSKGRSVLDLALMNNHCKVAAVFEEWRLEQLVSSMEKQGVEQKGHCAQCGVEYVGEDHESSIIHMVNTGHLPSEGYAYGISQSNRGYKMLKAHGWTETAGLGKHGEGRKYPIKTVLKRNHKGLGMERRVARVTHFHAYDEKAVKSAPKRMKLKRVIAEKTSREKRLEIKYRRLLS